MRAAGWPFLLCGTTSQGTTCRHVTVVLSSCFSSANSPHTCSSVLWKFIRNICPFCLPEGLLLLLLLFFRTNLRHLGLELGGGGGQVLLEMHMTSGESIYAASTTECPKNAFPLRIRGGGGGGEGGSSKFPLFSQIVLIIMKTGLPSSHTGSWGHAFHAAEESLTVSAPDFNRERKNHRRANPNHPTSDSLVPLGFGRFPGGKGVSVFAGCLTPPGAGNGGWQEKKRT